MKRANESTGVCTSNKKHGYVYKQRKALVFITICDSKASTSPMDMNAELWPLNVQHSIAVE